MTEAEKWVKIGEELAKGFADGINMKHPRVMTEEEAKRIILDDPNGNIVKRMEAIAVARLFLGENCTMKEVWEWAENRTN